MQKVFIFCFFVIYSCQIKAQELVVTNLQCQYQDSPSGVEDASPGLSWQLNSSRRNVMQSAYRVLVSDNEGLLQQNTGNIWDSKKVNSDQSIQVTFVGKNLLPGKLYYWKVMVWDNYGIASKWSNTSSWQMGLLHHEDWKGAQWIAYEKMPDSLRILPGIHGKGDPALGSGKDILPLLRKEFLIKKPVKKATAYIAGLGQFDLNINGRKVGDHFLDAGWTEYSKTALYVTFDITGQLINGANALGVMLGNGFYYTPRERYRKITIAYGYPEMICRVAVEYSDGSFENIVSDTTWKTSPGPVTFSSIYGGEDFDANVEQPGWDAPSFNDQSWRNAVIVDGPPVLSSQTAPPLKILDTFSIKKISQPKPGIWVYDFGQNASGIFSIKIKGKKHSKVTFRPAELITGDGLITQDAVGAPVYFNYTLNGAETESWQPQFTYYGFRYIQVEGAVPNGEPNPNNLPVIVSIKSLHTRNASLSAGSFNCSNNLFNRIDTLINWAIKSNMASVFTDCPHREKLGWLEEDHLMGSSIKFNYNIAALCRKVVNDMISAQTEDGLVPDIAPEYVHFVSGFRDSPEWGSNSIILPWYLYKWYGDTQVLTKAYPMMQRYVQYLQKKSVDNILSYGLGDWFDIGPDEPGESQLTPKGVTATAIYYYDLSILSKIAKILSKEDDVSYYESSAAKVRDAFNKTFFNKQTKQYATGSQTANAMAVYMGLVEPKNKKAVIDNLVKDIRERKNSLTAGDIGYRYVLRVLEENGYSNVIFDMNSRSDVPGYGYQLAHGATSLTESWQAYRFVSNNHLMLGHLMEWFYSGLGGIRQTENSVGFKHIFIHPEPVGDVANAETIYHSVYGIISTRWEKNERCFKLEVNIPANTYATIFLPVSEKFEIMKDGHLLHKKDVLKIINTDNRYVSIVVGSGLYQFQVNTIK
ncbi:MAG: family 78 glycoside hydrolase catalytic domain [Bacteroidetes bacterium]|nr:family 78 glycoside hydrolase catalytic domain [Bacteroidota bacterium]